MQQGRFILKVLLISSALCQVLLLLVVLTRKWRTTDRFEWTWFFFVALVAAFPWPLLLDHVPELWTTLGKIAAVYGVSLGSFAVYDAIKYSQENSKAAAVPMKDVKVSHLV